MQPCYPALTDPVSGLTPTQRLGVARRSGRRPHPAEGFGGRVQPVRDQPFPFLDPVWMVELEDGDSDPTDAGQGFDGSPDQLEVFPPAVLPWVEEPHDESRLPVDRRDVAPLGGVALRAGE